MSAIPTYGEQSQAASAAAEALAARDFNGVANNFDPTVSGQVAVVGSTMRTLDGAKSWVKTGTGDTQWTPLHAITGTFGSNVDTWDTTALVTDLAPGTLGAFKLRVCGVVSTTLKDISFRVDGAAPTVWRHVTLVNQVDDTPAAHDEQAVLCSLCSGWFDITIDYVPSPISTVRPTFAFRCLYSLEHLSQKVVSMYGTLFLQGTLPIAHPASIGISVSGATMGAASVATITRY